MVDADLVRKKLAFIKTCIRELRELAQPDRLEHDVREELFDLLEHAGWLPEDLAARLRDMAGFRNVVVHGYETVDLAVVRDVVEHRLGDLIAFSAVVRGRLGPD